MKKILCIVLILMLLLVSCDNNSASPSTDPAVPQTTVATTAASSPIENLKPDDDNDGENEKVDLAQCLTALLSNYSLNPVSALPETMVVGSQSHLVNPGDVVTDYSQSVSTNMIPQNGFGEQWNMVAENIYESQAIFNTLSVVEGLTTLSVAGFNNYLDSKSEEESAYYEFESGIYSVTIRCTETTIYYVLDYQIEVSESEPQNVQLALSMDIGSAVKKARIQIGDIAFLAYTFTDDEYRFALNIENARYAYFDIKKDDSNNYSGHIYEYLNLKDMEISSSVAEFYITDDYVTVVGNKASGLVGFDGYICELYSTASGKMLGYEVRETFSVEDAEAITYNTLWFNFEVISGINTIKYIPVNDDPIEYAFFVNESSKAWTAKKYGLSGGLKFASRRFDIEFRTQYCYSYDAENDEYIKHDMRIPMLFVQEEVFTSLIEDVRDINKIDISVTLSGAHLEKLKSEYAVKTDILIENKDDYSKDMIVDFIGNRIAFD